MKYKVMLLLLLGTSCLSSQEGTKTATGQEEKKPATERTVLQEIVTHLAKITKSVTQTALYFNQIQKLSQAMLNFDKADKAGKVSAEEQIENARRMLIEALPLFKNGMDTVTELVSLTRTINKELIGRYKILGSLDDPTSPVSMINRITLKLTYILKVFSGVLKAVAKVDPKVLLAGPKAAKKAAQEEIKTLEDMLKDLEKAAAVAGEEEELSEAPSYPAPQPPAVPKRRAPMPPVGD